MADMPIDQKPKEEPINIGNLLETSPRPSPRRSEDEAITASIISGVSADEVEEATKNGSRVPINTVKRELTEDPWARLGGRVEDAYEKGLDPEETVNAIAEEQEKERQFYAAGDNLYLEQAMALGDPTISAQSTRFATNLQIGQEVFEEALTSIGEDTTWLGYAADAVDRYLLRAFPIGGYEQITNRNERKGQELLEAALTMDPEQYKTYITSYVDELKEEGVFIGDNFFAIADGFAELQNAGYDEFEVFNRLMGGVDLLPAVSLARAIKAGTPLRRVSAMRGPEAAGDAAESLVQNNPAPNPRVVTDMEPSAIDPTDLGTGPRVPANRRAMQNTENAILREVQEITEQGALGRGVESAEVQGAYQQFVKNLKKTVNNPIVNVRHPLGMDMTGNPKISLTLGTVKTGRPYTTQKGAEDVAGKLRNEGFPTARSKAVDDSDPEKGWYIEIDDVLDVSDFIDDTIGGIKTNALSRVYARIFGSKATNEYSLLNDLAVMAENVGSAMTGGRAMKGITRTIEKLNTESAETISKVYSRLRDGPDAAKRTHYTDDEFRNIFKQEHPKGRYPTQEEIDAFHAVRTVNDAAYMLRAHLRMQKYIRNGYYGLTLRDGTKVAGRITDEALGNETIIDMKSGSSFVKRELHPKTRVWELDRELEGGIRYVVNPPKVRAISHTDVLGYNAGGRRINPEANYFVVLGKDSPRAFMTAITEEQANLAKTQIDNIQRAIAEAGDVATDSRRLDEVVRANNDWNPELQSLEDFTKFAKDKRLDFKRGVFIKSRDGEIRTGETRDFFANSWDEYVTFNMHRSDDTLIEFGGKETRNFDPVNAMFRDFGSVSQHFAHNVYTQTALEVWLKQARREGSGWKVDATSNPLTAFRSARFEETTNKRATELLRQYNIIKGRLGMKSEVFQRMESYGADVQEFLYNKTSGKIKLPRDPAKGVANKILTIGHQSAFGFGNVGQFFVQGYHALTIAAMTQKFELKMSTGMKALGMAPATRLILMGAEDAATEKEMVQRLAKWAGQTVEEMQETIDYIRTQGRDILDGSMTEQGTGVQWNLRGWKGESFLPSRLNDAYKMAGKATGQGLKVGLMPFGEGERLARLTGINAAILEFRAKFPGQSLNTASARLWITRRDQALTFRMTNVNRAWIQEGFGKLPTQWFSYTLRAMESVIIGKDLSASERSILFMTLFPAFGLTGMGAAAATDWVAELVGAEPAGEAYTLIKRGMWDYMTEVISGGRVELALAERLAPWTLVQDVYKNVQGDKAAWEIALGPSGDIGSNIIEQLLMTAGNLVNGHSVSMTEDAVRTIRQISGIDNIFKAIGIYQNGVYRGRTGTELPFEMDTSDAIGALLGFSPREVSEWYQQQNWNYQDSRKVKDFTTEIENDYRRAMEMYHNGDKERALKYIAELELRIVASGFSPYDQQKIRGAMRRMVDTSLYDMIQDQYRRENPYRAEVLEETFRGD